MANMHAICCLLVSWGFTIAKEHYIGLEDPGYGLPMPSATVVSIESYGGKTPPCCWLKIVHTRAHDIHIDNDVIGIDKCSILPEGPIFEAYYLKTEGTDGPRGFSSRHYFIITARKPLSDQPGGCMQSSSIPPSHLAQRDRLIIYVMGNDLELYKWWIEFKNQGSIKFEVHLFSNMEEVITTVQAGESITHRRLNEINVENSSFIHGVIFATAYGVSLICIILFTWCLNRFSQETFELDIRPKENIR